MIRVLKGGAGADERREADDGVRRTVEEILADVERRGDEAVRHYSAG